MLLVIPLGGCTVSAPATGRMSMERDGGRIHLDVQIGPLSHNDWPKPAGRTIAFIRIDHSQWLGITALYPEDLHRFRMLLTGTNRSWSLSFSTRGYPFQNALAFVVQYPSLVSDAVDLLESSDPAARSLMDPATRDLIDRLRSGRPVPIEAIAVQREMLAGTVTGSVAPF